MNVFEVVKENVTARQAAEAYGLKVGRTGMACCPFHSDKSPSMKLDERYYCFGCGATGDAVDLTAKLYCLLKRNHSTGRLCCPGFFVWSEISSWQYNQTDCNGQRAERKSDRL